MKKGKKMRGHPIDVLPTYVFNIVFLLPFFKLFFRRIKALTRLCQKLTNKS